MICKKMMNNFLLMCEIMCFYLCLKYEQTFWDLLYINMIWKGDYKSSIVVSTHMLSTAMTNLFMIIWPFTNQCVTPQVGKWVYN